MVNGGSEENLIDDLLNAASSKAYLQIVQRDVISMVIQNRTLLISNVFLLVREEGAPAKMEEKINQFRRCCQGETTAKCEENGNLTMKKFQSAKLFV